MLEFTIGFDAKPLPYWMNDAVIAGDIVIHGNSVDNIQYYHVNGRVAGPGDTVTYDGTHYNVIAG